jgi:hypothetical protein
MRLVQLLILALALAGALGWAASTAGAETSIGPDGTPQFDRDAETERYTDAAPLQLKTYLKIVLAEVDALPDDPDPSQVKQSPLRKRLLDLRLIMDLNAFAYRQHDFGQYRDQVDAAYESLGAYKDLFDQQKLTGLPIDQDRRAERLETLNAALDWFRDPENRRELQHFIAAPADHPLTLDDKEQPRLWRLAETLPNGDLNSVANAALLSSLVLTNLERDGVLVDDILNPDDEAHFHDIRKAMRSVLVLADMFPSLAQATADRREPLADLVDAYGEVNDRSIAYHDAQDDHGDVDTRASELQIAFAQAQKLVKKYVDSGQLDNYVARLDTFLAIYGH